jgi:predicted HAD superfamily Cof-like phosphohydrolase
MEEEFKEFIEAHWNKDDIEMLDGCMDLIWVTLGFCNMKGYNIVAAWDEVLRSNMKKVDPITRKVIRREDGKILKPEGWTPPDLSKFIK